jgi:hypothetical protein
MASRPQRRGRSEADIANGTPSLVDTKATHTSEAAVFCSGLPTGLRSLNFHWPESTPCRAIHVDEFGFHFTGAAAVGSPRSWWGRSCRSFAGLSALDVVQNHDQGAGRRGASLPDAPGLVCTVSSLSSPREGVA